MMHMEVLGLAADERRGFGQLMVRWTGLCYLHEGDVRCTCCSGEKVESNKYLEVVQFHPPKVARFDMPSMKTHSLSLCYTIWVIFFTIVAKASPYIYALTFKLEVVLRKICCILRAVVLFGALDGFLFVVC
jgi:hypothetical protein